MSAMPAAPAAGRPLKVFVSYSHQDNALWKRLDVHLSLLQRQGILKVWHDRCLQGGEHWEEAIDQNLEEADIVLLLISPDFIASDYCYGHELRVALARDHRGAAVVVPLLLRPCDWQSAPFARCQALPRDNQPISVHPQGENAAFSEVVAELRRLAETLRKRRRGEAHQPPSGAAHDPGGTAAARLCRRWLVRRWPLLAGLSGGTALLLGLLLGPPWLAHWQLERGDQAFRAYAKGDGSQWEPAVLAWQQAAQLDRRSAAAQARLGFLADLEGELDLAETAWRRALDLQPDPDPEARRHRNGLANVLMQLPGRRAEALRLFDGDNNAPRSALDAAMLRWQEPAQLPQALDAVSNPALAAALAGPADTQREAWGFKQRNQLLVFETLGHQRCLLSGVRAATSHLLGRGAVSPPLASADCEGIGSGVQELLCARLQQALATNPRAVVTARWLACPAPSRPGSAPAAGSSG